MARYQSDFLVIGSGIAGLNFALNAADLGTVHLITKQNAEECNTSYAQGGVAAVNSKDDKIENHFRDTLEAGAGLCHKDSVEVLVKEGPERIKDLIQWGVAFTKKPNSDEYELAMEGGHSKPRIFHVKDYTGASIIEVMLKKAREHPNIHLFENHYAIDIITEHHVLGNLQPAFNICFGAYIYSTEDKMVHIFESKYTMLATGGGSRSYLYSTNPKGATGDGLAMAYRAGVRIANMEFVQFHPTALYHQADRLFLISEALRGFGGKLINKSGERFMTKYDNRKELAPRDIVARAIDSELKKNREDYVYLDMTHLNSEDVRQHFPHIYDYCLKTVNLDITSQPIPVVPAAHYLCGGVMSSLNGQTSMQNLFVCGEIAHTGIHGANRLASNSLLEGLVFSYRAAMKIKSKKQRSFSKVTIPDWDESGTANLDEWYLIKHNLLQIRQLMWDYVGIIRSKQTLERAYRRIRVIVDETENYYRRNKLNPELIELRNLSVVALIIISSAIRRNESRGCHYMSDYPARDDKYLKNTIL